MSEEETPSITVEKVSSMRKAELIDLAEDLGLEDTEGMRKNEIKGLILDHLSNIVPF